MALGGSSGASTFDGKNWSPKPLNFGDNLGDIPSAISCSSREFCVATDEVGDASVFNGTSWSGARSLDSDQPLASVSCPVDGFCLAVDPRNAFIYEDHRWSKPIHLAQMDAVGLGALVDASCTSERSCVVVGDDGGLYAYDGSSWGMYPGVDPSGGFLAISCVSEFCMATDTQASTLSYDGTAWVPSQVDNLSANITAVSCPSSSMCMGVDADGDIYSWSPSSLKTLSQPPITTEPPPPLATTQAVSLDVTEVATPWFPVEEYVTKGSYPQVSGDGVDLEPVNDALRSMVLEDQQNYAISARTKVPDPHISDDGDGVYQTMPDPTLISASSTVVSVLLLDEELYPGGTDGGGCISLTVEVPSATKVDLLALFSADAHPLQVLSALSRSSLLSTGWAPILNEADPTLPLQFFEWLGGSGPDLANFPHFALTSGGLALGMQVSIGCDPVTIPYSSLIPYLSPLGRALVNGVREPLPQG
jgi:hypothetical protein